MPDDVKNQMNSAPSYQQPDLAGLKKQLGKRVLDDRFSRGRYATDASIYQMVPYAVVIPETVEDVRRTLDFARENGLAVLPRGGGTSQCGQTVNHAIVLDQTRHLNKIVSLDVENRRCVVQPGIVLDDLNRQLKPHGLWFPVDVSTSSRATIGGMAGNNSCGGRSLRYGIMRDNVHAIKAILSDGSEAWFGDLDKQQPTGKLAEIWPELEALGRENATLIAEKFPKVLRRVGGIISMRSCRIRWPRARMARQVTALISAIFWWARKARLPAPLKLN